MPEIIVKLGDQVVQRYVFDKDVCSIGRARDNDIVVENLSVSRNHARIRLQDGKYLLTDLNSANGSFVNGVKVTRTELVDDDIISIGKHKLHFISPPVAMERGTQKGGAPAQTARTFDSGSEVPAVLFVMRGKQQDRRFPLKQGRTTIGRANDNDIRLHDWFVSKKHAVISLEGGRFILRDLGSWRGTMVNGTATKEATLKENDKIMFGNTVLEFRIATPEELEKLASMPPEPDLPSDMNELMTGGPPPGQMLQPGERPSADAHVRIASRTDVPVDPRTPARETPALEEGEVLNVDNILGEDESLDAVHPMAVQLSTEADDEFAPLSEEELEQLEREASGDWNTTGKVEAEAAEWEQVEAERMMEMGAGWNSRKRGPLLESDQQLRAGERAAVNPKAVEAVDTGVLATDPADLDREEESGLFAGSVEEPPSGSGAHMLTPPQGAAKTERGAPRKVPAESAENAALNEMKLPPGVNPEEVRVYLRALRNRSRVIRREAARKLKELTGIEYEWESPSQ